MIDSFFKHFGYGMAILNLVVLLVIGYLWFGPAPVPIIYNEPFPLDKTEVARGEQISYLIHFSKRADYDAVLNRNIICEDGNRVTMSSQTSSVPKGEHKIWVPVTIPQKTSLGSCYLEMSNVYRVNPIRTEIMVVRTQSFNVIE